MCHCPCVCGVNTSEKSAKLLSIVMHGNHKLKLNSVLYILLRPFTVLVGSIEGTWFLISPHQGPGHSQSLTSLYWLLTVVLPEL